MTFPSRTILIIDDSLDRKLYRRYLQHKPDYADTILETAWGQEGLELWQDYQPDAVLLNEQLPDLDSLEFLAKLQSSSPQPCLPVIIISEKDSAVSAVQAIKAGAQDYLVKSEITPECLQRAVHEAIAAVELCQRQPEELRRKQKAEENERILEALMEYIPEGITIADAPDVHIRQVSRYGQQMTGQPKEVIEGIRVEEHAAKWKIFYADGRTAASGEDLPLTRAVQQGEVVTNEEWVLQRPDGKNINVLCNAGPIYNDGEITGGVIAWRDISDRVQLERERQRILQQEQAARQEAERVNRIKDEFIAIISHELRSPLTPILGWSKLLQIRRFDEAKTIQALKSIERNAQLQSRLVDELLDTARLLCGKLSVDLAPVRLASVIQSAIETIKTAAVDKSIAIELSLPDIGYVSGDYERLQQVVSNLLSNAVKFTPQGGRVKVELERSGDQAQIRVADTGKGISPEFLPHIFETFCQEQVSCTCKHGGLGLGLAIADYLVKAHGGTITADSPGEGQGATFTVRLPWLGVDPPSASEKKRQIDLTGIRILLVDDEPDTRELLNAMLEQYGAETTAVASAREGLTLLNSKPDILIIDIGLPDLDGYTFLKQVRSLPPEQGGLIPAIALSAHARDEDRQQAALAGFQKHLAKPSEPGILIAAIADLVN